MGRPEGRPTFLFMGNSAHGETKTMRTNINLEGIQVTINQMEELVGQYMAKKIFT